MKYTIITAVHNGERYISRLVNSIFSQTYPHIEWVVQDACSADKTLDILYPFRHKIDLVSEPDSGVYDAWNKAVDRATGDWVIFLGCDDHLVSQNTIAQIHHHLRKLHPSIAMAYGALVQGRDGKIERLMNRNMYRAYSLFCSNMGIPFPATFIRLSALKENKFDMRYKIAGDYDWAARTITGHNLARIPVVVSYMEKGGLSENGGSLLLEERIRVLVSRVAPKAKELIETSVKYLANSDNRLEEIL